MVAVNGVYDQDVEPEIAHEVEDAVVAAVEDLPKSRRKDDAQVKEAARLAVRRSIRALCGKRPQIDVHLVRVQVVCRSGIMPVHGDLSDFDRFLP